MSKLEINNKEAIISYQLSFNLPLLKVILVIISYLFTCWPFFVH